MVWGVLRLVTQLSGRANGLVAGAFTALAPVLVWYSQELRMFQPAATALVWAAFFLVAAREHLPPLDNPPGRGATSTRILCWLGLVAALILALYSYLYAAFFLPGLGLSVFLLARRRGSLNRRYLLESVAAFAVVALLFLPLARSAWRVNSASGTPGSAFVDFLPNLWRQLRIFTVWHTGWPSSVRTAAVLFFALLVLTGLLLAGVELAACEIITPVVAARDVLYHPPSGWVHLRLWLRKYEEVSEASALFALVQSADGQIWGRSLERAGDVLSVYPPTMWQPNEFVRVELDVNLNPLASPGPYTVKVEAEGEPGVPCGTVQLE